MLALSVVQQVGTAVVVTVVDMVQVVETFEQVGNMAVAIVAACTIVVQVYHQF